MAKTMSANSWHTSIIRERLFELLLHHCIAHFSVANLVCPVPESERRHRLCRSRCHLRSRHPGCLLRQSGDATADARVITSPHPSPKERGREERAARKGGFLALQSFLRSVVREQEEDILCEGMAMLLCKNRGAPHSYFCGPQPQKNVFAIVHTPRRMRGGREVVQQIRQCGRERGREDERQEDERMKG